MLATLFHFSFLLKKFFLLSFLFLLLFDYSGLHFLPTPPPNPSQT